MNLDEMAKYLIWIVFFALVLTGLYFMLKKLGVL
jgi:hypothetical protein